MTPKPRPFQVVKKNRDQLSKLTGRATIPLDKRATPVQLFKSSLYNESGNAFASPAYLAGQATDAQPVSGNPQVRLEEPPAYQRRQRAPGTSWREIAEQSEQQRQQIAEQSKYVRTLETHRDNQERLHSLARPHDQSACRHCNGEQPSALRQQRPGQTYTYTVPQVSISPEAQKNHERMLSLMNKARRDPTLLKSWYDNSTDPLAQNLLHKMGLAHHQQFCPSCQSGEKMNEKRLFQ